MGPRHIAGGLAVNGKTEGIGILFKRFEYLVRKRRKDTGKGIEM